MDLGLAGRVALVTGGSKGIGRACASALAGEGVQVAISARGCEALDDAAADIRANTGVNVLALQADVTRPTDIEQMVAQVVKQLGRLDILVNAAASLPAGAFLELPDEAWLRAMESKCLGYVRCARAVVPQMIRQGAGGRIINIAGTAAKKVMPGNIAASAANAALLIFTAGLAAEVAEYRILVNAVNPGPIATERLDTLLAARAATTNTSSEGVLAGIISQVPLGRLGTPDEVADVVVFLASVRASFITGTYLAVDGGMSKGI